MQGKYLEADGLDPKVIYFLVNTVDTKKKRWKRVSQKKLYIFHVSVRNT